jgi:hypothetical protein
MNFGAQAGSRLVDKYLRGRADAEGWRIEAAERTAEDLRRGQWDPRDAGLFRAGDYLVGLTSADMKDLFRHVRQDCDLAADLAARGLQTVGGRHTCVHRVEELPAICTGCGAAPLTGEAAGAA